MALLPYSYIGVVHEQHDAELRRMFIGLKRVYCGYLYIRVPIAIEILIR